MSSNIEITLDVEDALGILAILEVIKETYKVTPYYKKAMFSFTQSIANNITQEQLDSLEATLEVDNLLKNVNIKKDDTK